MLLTDRKAGLGAKIYVYHRLARTLLAQIVDEYYPTFKQYMEALGAPLPGYF